MIKLNKNKLGQSLPLNTIVIAILVIIVLLVIIVFFTTQVGSTGDQLDDNSASQCSLNNPAIATLGYTSIQPIKDGEKCSDFDDLKDHKQIPGISNCCVK